MSAHVIPDNIRDKVNRIYKGADKDRVIKALEAGKTVYHGAVKLRANKVEGKAEVASAAPAAPAKSDSKTDDKKGKDK
jgi:hypothetical protein